jgi:hypothetical protein
MATMAERIHLGSATETHSPSWQAYKLLHVGFVVAPIIAGVDKFTGLLTDWSQYLAPVVARNLGYGFLSLVGVVEIAAGLLVAFKPKIGGVVVALWLWAIILNLLMIPAYYDIALRDFGLSLAALALARLAAAQERQASRKM